MIEVKDLPSARVSEFERVFNLFDANGDDAISIDEMNVAMSSVGEQPLSENDSRFLARRFGNQPLTWSRFIEMLLLT